jgi:hypothetical protein
MSELHDLRHRIDQALVYLETLPAGWIPADAQPFFDEVLRILHTPGPGHASSRIEWACAYADTAGFGEPRAVERDTAEGWVAFANAHNNPASLVRRTVIYSTWEPA